MRPKTIAKLSAVRTNEWRLFHRVHTISLEKKSRTFPALSRTTARNFPGPFRSPWMVKYKENTPFTHNIRSIVHCRNCSTKQNVESQRRQSK